MSKPAKVLGGVLSETAIRNLVKTKKGRPLIDGWEEDNLRAARYDVRLARDNCLLPDGHYFDSDKGEELTGPLVLHSGDSAWISTHERFCLPSNVTGMVTLKTELANAGLLLMSGALIDPEYGSSESAGDRRLHFFVANLGAQTITLHPDVTPVAAVQFFYISEPCKRQLPPSTPPHASTGLGFIENLKTLQLRYRELSKEVHRTRTLLNNLIILGYFVLGTAVVSATLATLLTIGSNKSLSAAVDRTIPDSADGKALIAVALLSTGWIIYSTALMINARRREPRSARRRDSRETALIALHLRTRERALKVLLIVPLLVSVVVWAVSHWNITTTFWPLWIFLGSAILGVCVYLLLNIAQPPTESKIRAEMDRIATS